MGHSSRDAGKPFEGRVATAFDDAVACGVVRWYAHQQPAFTMSGRPIKRSGADYVGVLSSGLSIAVEVKSTKAARLARDAIETAQSTHLAAVAESGGLSLLAMEFRNDATGQRHHFIVPWKFVPWRTLRTAESVAPDLLADFVFDAKMSIADMITRCEICSRAVPRRSFGAVQVEPWSTCCRRAAPAPF